MIAVIFELLPRPGCRQAYLDAASSLSPQLEQVDGFIMIERFESLSQPGKLLSLSFWRDEAAVSQWRNHPPHRAAQAAGRRSILDDYRLRVARLMRDYSLSERAEAPVDAPDWPSI